ncbi:hypothetical protein N431DRAFT_32042 [Stipitochalara longipes BDJ]|nr:hypothetical protein N431DRAFT_32042 [Stipitochalara longipes BDJ]
MWREFARRQNLIIIIIPCLAHLSTLCMIQRRPITKTGITYEVCRITTPACCSTWNLYRISELTTDMPSRKLLRAQKQPALHSPGCANITSSPTLSAAANTGFSPRRAQTPVQPTASVTSSRT